MHITLQQNNHTHLSFLLQLNWSPTYQENTNSLQISLFSVHVYISLFIVHIYAITLYRTHAQQISKNHCLRTPPCVHMEYPKTHYS